MITDFFPNCTKDKQSTEPEKFFPLLFWGIRTAGNQLPPAQGADAGQKQLNTQL